jgi:LacI family transcriptional regulator
MTTIRHIAKRAGVSIGTVDRVIHGRGKVAPRTEERIRSAIDALGYRPNVFARSLKLSKRFRFGLVMPFPDEDGGYWKLPLLGIELAGNELATQNIEIVPLYFHKYHEAPFNTVVVRLDQNDLDGFLIAPVLTQYMPMLIEHLPQKIPYVFFDSDLPGHTPLSVITQNAYQSGRLAAHLMEKMMSQFGKTAVIKIIPEDYHISARAAGFIDYMKSAIRDVLVSEADTEDNPERIHTLTSGLLDQYPELAGIFVTNALTCRVAEVLSQNERHPKPVLIGYDLIEPNAEWLEKGVIDFIISQRPETQGYQGIYQLYRRVVLNEPVDLNISIPLDIITRENLSRQPSYQ